MATTTERRVILVDVKGSAAAVKHMRQLQKAAKNVDTNIARMGKTLGSLGNTMKAYIAYRLTAYVASAVPAFLNLSDAVSSMKAKLDLTNDSMGGTSEIMNELFDVAERSRGSIEAVSTLYTRLSVASKDLGVSQQQVMDFTELLSDTFVLSGASAGEAASGVTQMSQAISKGKLDGDEFKSTMENNVYFASLLAKSLGVTRGELQKMSKDGQLTSDKLIAMGANLEEVRKKMKNMPVTSAQVGTAWGNAFAKMLTDSESFSEVIEKINKVLFEAAGKAADYFDDSPIKLAERALEDYNKEMESLLEKQQKLANVVLFGGSKEEAGWEYRNTSAERLGVMLDQVNSKIKQLSKLTKQAAIDLQLIPLSTQFYGPPEPPKGSSTAGGDTNKISDKQKALESFRKTIVGSWGDTDILTSKIKLLDEYLFSGTIGESRHNAELEKLTGTTNDLSAELEELNGVTSSLRSPFEVLVDDMKRLDEIAVLLPDKIDQIREAQAKMAKAFETKSEDGGTSFVDWGQQAENAIGGVTGAFIDMAISGKNSFEDFAKSFLVNMAKMIAQQMVLNALKNSTVFGGLFASGGVVNNGVQTFASGGVVSSPTIFPMANGIGLVGEAGAEAILPLKRGKNGDLGVQMEGGGGGNVTINQNINGNGDRNLAMAVQQGAQKGYQLFLEDVKRNGPGRRNMGV